MRWRRCCSVTTTASSAPHCCSSRTYLPLAPWQIGAVVSAMTLGAMLGSLSSGSPADRYGRRGNLLASGVIFIVAALGTGLAPSVTALILFRFILGLAIGIASVTVPLYLAEMAPAHDRGVITSLNQYMIIVGGVLASAVGFGLAFVGSWRWMLLIGVFPAVVLVVGMFTMPDTPRSLIRRGQTEDARAVLVGLRGNAAEAERELAEITTLERQERNTPGRALLTAPWVRRLLLLGALLAIFQQVTGINAIVYYGPTILTDFGVSKTITLLFFLLNGLVNIGTIALDGGGLDGSAPWLTSSRPRSRCACSRGVGVFVDHPSCEHRHLGRYPHATRSARRRGWNQTTRRVEVHGERVLGAHLVKSSRSSSPSAWCSLTVREVTRRTPASETHASHRSSINVNSAFDEL
ncbi:MAG: MFS transporter [Pseudonocardiaceae bacterium]